MKHVILAMVVLLASASAAAAQTVFVVRHAERADAAGGGEVMMKADPGLSEAGRARAESLAATLKDAGVTAIFITEYRRTRDTAAPLAKRLGIEPQKVPAKDTAALLERLKSAKGNVLVVGHSNTVPEIVKGLGIATPVAVGESDYDNLFVVTPGDRPSLLRLHFR
jgi:broad specificity phosphatase PhoE